MRIELKPLTKSTQKQRPYGVADIEANNWIDHLVTGFYCKDRFGHEVLEYFHSGKHDVLDFLDFITSDENPVDEIFCHFGGGYDFLFFMKAAFDEDFYHVDKIIPRGSNLLCFELSRLERTNDYDYFCAIDPKFFVRKERGYWYFKARTIMFRDSGAMLPSSLDSLTQNFGVSNKKLQIDYKNMKVNAELLEYLESDLKGLYQVIEKYRQWPLIVKAGSASTIAAQAMKIFRTTMSRPLKSIPKKADLFVREAYFGGRTEIFKPLYNPGPKAKPLNCFDVNSLYPTVMRSTDRFPGNFKEFTYDYDPDHLGYFEAEVEVPSDMYVPPLATIHDVNGTNKLIFPTGRFKGKWSVNEIEYARSLGVKIISTGKGAIFEDAGSLFRRYVDLLYEIRERSDKNSVDNVLAKLLLNSCYGRFGLNLNREKIEFDEGQEGVKFLAEMVSNKGRTFRLMTKEFELENSFSNVGIAGWVTAESKIFMHKKLLPIENSLYYMDTDSLFTPEWLEDVAGLGGLKHEYSANAACFLLPKTYAIKSLPGSFKMKDKNNKVTLTDRKVVMKGFDKKDVSHFTLEDFIACLEGDMRRLSCKTSSKMARFKTAIKKGNLLMMLDESERGIKSTYDKRRIVKTSKGYDTEPLVIKNGQVVNLKEGRFYESSNAERNVGLPAHH